MQKWGGNLANHNKKRGFAISGILYPILILTLFLVVQVLFMLQTRKNVLDKARTELADSVNSSNQIYTNEELSTLIQDQKKAIDTLNAKVSSLESENKNLKSGVDTINNNLGSYVLKSQIGNPHSNIKFALTNIHDGGHGSDLFSRDYKATPNDYKINGGAVYTEFKSCSALGLNCDFAVLETYTVYGPKDDFSGGLPFQFAMSHGIIYKRDATGPNTWGSWRQLH